VVSRGYGGAARGCVDVQPDSLPADVGDEPLLIRVKTHAPVVVGRDRVAAARTLLARHPGVDVIVSDDGLQHYRLQRDIELAVIDAATGLGNGWPLPAGPLREPRSRLRSVDAVIQVVRGAAQPESTGSASWRADYTAGQAWRLRAPQEKKALRDLPSRDWLAVTGIGRPQGFFDMLQAEGIRFSPRAFADHHAFQPQELPADAAVLMTEKDAVKCLAFAGTDWWAVELEVAPETGFIDWLSARIKR
jgi:tetraacyldisaccharide 4'-kinase